MFTAIITIPGAGILWLVNQFSQPDVDEKDFRLYTKRNFNRLKVEEQKWLH